MADDTTEIPWGQLTLPGAAEASAILPLRNERRSASLGLEQSDLFARDLAVAAGAEDSRARALVHHQVLGVLEATAVEQIVSDAVRAEVAAD